MVAQIGTLFTSNRGCGFQLYKNSELEEVELQVHINNMCTTLLEFDIKTGELVLSKITPSYGLPLDDYGFVKIRKNK